MDRVFTICWRDHLGDAELGSGTDSRWSKPDSSPRSHFSDPSFLIEIPGSRETPKREIALTVEARDVLLKRLDLGPRLDDCDELYSILFGANFYVARFAPPGFEPRSANCFSAAFSVSPFTPRKRECFHIGQHRRSRT
jgi:hypothetical protein